MIADELIHQAIAVLMNWVSDHAVLREHQAAEGQEAPGPRVAAPFATQYAGDSRPVIAVRPQRRSEDG